MAGFDHFNLFGPIYDLVFGLKKDDDLVAKVAIENGQTLLDVGGGTGRVTILFKSNTNKTIIADSARKMLKEAQLKEIHCVQSVSEHLPFKNRYFDRIIMVDALHHVRDQQRTLNEMWRLLSPGGKIVIEEGDIHHWLVKLVSWGEKILFMRSHFLSPEEIVAKCQFDSTAKVDLFVKNGLAWVIISKIA